MRYRYKKFSRLIPVLLSCAFFGCRSRSDNGKWETFLLGIPEEVTTRRAVETATYYILKQTHEPLIRRDDGQNYRSRLLKDWSRDLQAKSYTFCPDVSLKFNDHQSFDLGFFEAYIKGVTKQYAPDFKLSRAGGCFKVSFQKPRKGYLDFLASYEHAPTVQRAGGIEDGLGPFSVVSVNADRIELSRKSKIRNGYNEIVAREFNQRNAAKYDFSRASDINNISASDASSMVWDNYVSFDTIQLRSDVVVINHPDRGVRRQVYNCLDVDAFRRAFLPQRNDFYDIKNILPVGVLGAVPGRPEQVCTPMRGGNKKEREIVLYNHKGGNTGPLEKFAAGFNARSGLRLKIVQCTPQQLVRVLHKYPRPFNLAVLGLDTVAPDYQTFFDCFVREDGYFDFKLPRISKLYYDMGREDDPDLKLKLVSKILGEIYKEAVVLPLCQTIRKSFYPRQIKNINIGRGFIEYPEVGDFRW